jgi:hypothetical protein
MTHPRLFFQLFLYPRRAGLALRKKRNTVIDFRAPVTSYFAFSLATPEHDLLDHT